MENALILYAVRIMRQSVSLRTWRAVLFATALSAALASVSVRAATQSVAIGEVAVTSAGDEAFAEAMRTALVRATGKRAAAQDPAFAALRADPRRYVQIFRPASAGSAAVVVFDIAAIERGIEAAGRAVWSRERPLVLVAIVSAPPGADPATVRAALEAAGSARGLPLRLSSAQSAGLQSGEEPSAQAALAAARRAGADVALIGQADGSEWQWTLFDGEGSVVFPGGVAAGIDGTAETLSSLSHAVVARAESAVILRIDGVRTLADHVRVQRAASALTGVRGVVPLEVEAERASFRLQVAGGAAALLEALKGVRPFASPVASGERVDVRFEP